MLEQIRGDTIKYYFQRLDAEGNVITDTPESLYFTVKKDYKTKDFFIQKTLADMAFDTTDSTWHFTLDPADTDNMKYGTYVYDVQVVQDGIKTTIAKGDFVLEEEVTFVTNEN